MITPANASAMPCLTTILRTSCALAPSAMRMPISCVRCCIYGLMAYSVQQRTQEIGIRMALGASAQDVRKMVVRQGMALALAGVIIGVAAALGVTRLMASLLYGVTPKDPIAMTSVALLLVGVALAATYLPARRASQMDPVESLRYE